jgi:hypothetical protein
MAITCGTVDINARNEDVFPVLRLPRELRDSVRGNFCVELMTMH